MPDSQSGNIEAFIDTLPDPAAARVFMRRLEALDQTLSNDCKRDPLLLSRMLTLAGAIAVKEPVTVAEWRPTAPVETATLTVGAAGPLRASVTVAVSVAPVSRSRKLRSFRLVRHPEKQADR